MPEIHPTAFRVSHLPSFAFAPNVSIAFARLFPKFGQKQWENLGKSNDGFRLITNNRSAKKGGGVGFYVTQDLNCELLEKFTVMSDSFESIFIEIKAPNRRSIIVGEIYRPPNSNAVEFVELLHDLFSDNLFDNKSCFIMGDFNLNLLNHNDNTPCQDFFNFMLSKSFIPLTRKPTQISDTSSTLIDNIFVNSSFSDITSGIIVFRCN